MALTKRQKRFLLENCSYLTLSELGEKIGVSGGIIEDYLKKNKKKIYSGSLNKKVDLTKGSVLMESEIEGKDLGFWKIVKKNWLFLLIVVLGVLIIYFNSLHGDFVSDDYASITQDPLVADLKDTFNGFTLTKFSTFLIASIFGVESSIPYHVYSLLVYMVILVVAFVLLSLFFRKGVVYWTILVFAVLPIHVESVSWISGKPYLLSSLFVLSTLTIFFLYLKTKKKSYLWWLLAFLPLTYFADRVRSLSLVFLLILFLMTFGSEFKQINFKKILIYAGIAFGIVMIIITPLIIRRVGDVNSGYNTSDSIFYNPFFQYPTAMSKYLQLIFVPTDLTLYHTMYILPTWLNWVVLLIYLIALVYFWFRNKKLFFALAFIFAAAAPSMAPVKVSWLVAERYMFLGSLGFILFLALILEQVPRKLSWLTWMVLISLISLYSVRVIARNIDWQTNHNLWVNTCQVSPNSHNAWNNIGDDYDKLATATTDNVEKARQYENSIKGFTQSTAIKPNYADAYHNRANIFFKVGRLDLARDSYETALKYSPGLYQTYFSLVQIDIMEKQYNLALQQASTAVKLQPNLPQSHYVLGVVLAQMGDKTDSLKELNTCLQLSPGYQPAENIIQMIKSQT